MSNLKGLEFKNEVLLFGKLLEKEVETIVIGGVDYKILYMDIPRKECDKSDLIKVIVKDLDTEIKALMGKDKVFIKGMVCAYNVVNGYTSTFMCVKASSIVDGSEMDEPESNNIVKFEGKTCKKPRTRTTPKGKLLSEIVLKTKDVDGTDMYIFCLTWGKLARICRLISREDTVSIWGRFESREYEKVLEDGTVETRVTYEVSTTCLKNFKED